MRYSHIEVGVDWITLTMPREHPQASDMYHEAQNIIERLEYEGNEATIGARMGFDGVSIGNNFIGSREDRYCVQFTSINAQRYWRDVYRIGAHVSRIDVQCTVHYTDNTDEFGGYLYETSKNAAATTKGKPKWTVTTFKGNNGGCTVYLGSKDSEHFIRIYDKGAESAKQEYANAWRYECVLKNDYATEAAHTLFLAFDGAHIKILAFIQSYLLKRGIVSDWTANPSQAVLYTIGKTKTDRETALWWLANQVLPALDKAKKLGYYADALKALGIVAHSFDIVSRETGEVSPIEPWQKAS